MNLLTRFRRRNFLLATLLLGLASPLAAQQKTVAIPLADGFDYPIGKPDGKGYYVARGLRLPLPEEHRLWSGFQRKAWLPAWSQRLIRK